MKLRIRIRLYNFDSERWQDARGGAHKSSAGVLAMKSRNLEPVRNKHKSQER